jgi:lantibiotic modifying enzyme
VEARARLHKLATRAVELTRRAREPGAVPISASWCQGLAGISRTLLHGAELLGEPELAEPALGAAEACTAWVPRMQNVGQCCGLAGVGAFLLDLYRYTGEARHLTAAHGVGRQLLRRSFGPDDAPLFVDAKRTDAPLSWAMGTAGVLAFFRRLHHSEAPDPVPSAADVLRARSRTTRSESAGSYDVAPEHARSFSS